MAYDKTTFQSGLAMGLTGKGEATFTASDTFSKGYLVGAKLRAKRRIPTGYSYNGVVLPKLPEWDKTAYPYAVLRYAVGTIYHLYLSSVPMYVNNTSESPENLFLFDLLGCPTWITNTDTGEYVWEYYGEFKSNGQQVRKDSPYGFSKIWWSNFDLINRVDGTVYNAASEPVPIYE